MPDTDRRQARKLALEALEPGMLWSVQGNRETTLSDFCERVFSVQACVGVQARREALQLLQAWPQRALVCAAPGALPSRLEGLEALLTDVSHGYCRFALDGAQAVDFLAAHASADITAFRDAGACLRCLLGQYSVIAWWDRGERVDLLLERSHAGSFAEYTEALLARWRAPAL